jgi:hypothetical protein
MRTVVRATAILLVWIGVIFFLTWPLAPHVATHLPAIAVGGPLDSLLNGWALAHESRALVTDPRTFADGGIFWPAHRALFYGEAGFGGVPFFMPVFLATGNPTLALNFVLLSGLVLTAFAMHMVVARLTGSERAGLVAGAALATTPWFSWSWLPAVPSFGLLQYFPVIMLVAARPAVDRRTTLTLLALVVAQGLTTVYVAVPLIAPLIVLGAIRTARRPTRRAGVMLFGVLAGAGIVLAAAYSGYALVHIEDPHVATQTHWLAKPTDPLPAMLGTAARLGPLAVPPAALILIALGILCAWGRAGGGWSSLGAPPWRIVWLWTAVGLAIAIRPRADWRESLIAAPHSLVARFTPFYEVIRIPERLGLPALMGITVLAGLAFAECERVLARRRDGAPRPALVTHAATTGLLLLAVGAMYLTCQRNLDSPWLAFGPLPVSYPLAASVPLPAPALMEVLARPGGPLLELPVSSRPWPAAQAMWRSIYHRRPLLNGYNGYWPAGFPERMALAAKLPDADALDELTKETGVELVLVHAARYVDRLARQRWTEIAARGGDGRLALVARDGDSLLFRVVAAPGDG